MNERVDRTRRTYDKIAGRFLGNNRDRSVVLLWLGRFAEHLDAGATVLDLGAGPGCDSAELRRFGLRAISLDLSLGMLEAGLLEFPGSRVQADACQLPFRDGSVFVVLPESAHLAILTNSDAFLKTLITHARPLALSK